jgi:hypothetical protein
LLLSETWQQASDRQRSSGGAVRGSHAKEKNEVYPFLQANIHDTMARHKEGEVVQLSRMVSMVWQWLNRAAPFL